MVLEEYHCGKRQVDLPVVWNGLIFDSDAV